VPLELAEELLELALALEPEPELIALPVMGGLGVGEDDVCAKTGASAVERRSSNESGSAQNMVGASKCCLAAVAVGLAGGRLKDE